MGDRLLQKLHADFVDANLADVLSAPHVVGLWRVGEEVVLLKDAGHDLSFAQRIGQCLGNLALAASGFAANGQDKRARVVDKL